MAWYWIVLIIIGYLISSILFGTIIAIKEDDSNAAPFGLIWPLSLIIFIVSWVADYFLNKSRRRNW